MDVTQQQNLTIRVVLARLCYVAIASYLVYWSITVGESLLRHNEFLDSSFWSRVAQVQAVAGASSFVFLFPPFVTMIALARFIPEPSADIQVGVRRTAFVVALQSVLQTAVGLLACIGVWSDSSNNFRFAISNSRSVQSVAILVHTFPVIALGVLAIVVFQVTTPPTVILWPDADPDPIAWPDPNAPSDGPTPIEMT